MRYKIKLNREKLSREEIESHKDFDQFFSDYYKKKLYGKNGSGYWQWISRFWLGVIAGTIITVFIAWFLVKPETINFYISFSGDTLHKKSEEIYVYKNETHQEPPASQVPVSNTDFHKSSHKLFTLKNKKAVLAKADEEIVLSEADIFNPSKKLLRADTIIMKHLFFTSAPEGVCSCSHCTSNNSLKNEHYTSSKWHNKDLRLNGGEEVRFETMGKINTATLGPHQLIHFKLLQDITIGDETIISAGALASGEVIEITAARNPARELFIKIRLTSVDCHQIPLTSAVSYQLLLIKQKGMEIPVGAGINAFITARVNPSVRSEAQGISTKNHQEPF